MNIGNLFQVLLVHPILNIMVAIYLGLNALHVPYTLGFSIIALTIVIRFVLYPFTAAQLKTSKKMQEITPHVNRLKEKHKGDAQQLQAATMALYKEHGVNPLAGCLPMVIQLPVIWGLYFVLQHVVTYKLHDINSQMYFPFLHLPHIWNTSFFGLNLGDSPSKVIAHVGFLILLIPVLTAVLQFIQTKMMFTPQPKPVKTIDTKTGETKKEDSVQDFAAAFQSQSMYVFPVMIGFLSFTFPLGLSLYWNTFTIFGIIQQYKLSGWGGMASLLGKKSVELAVIEPAKISKPKKKKAKGIYGR